MTIPYIMGRDSITVMCDGVTHTIQADHVNYEALKDAIRSQAWDLVPDLVTPVKAMSHFVSTTQGRITITNDQVMYDGEVIHNSVATRILEIMKDGFDAQPLMRFLEKLMQNPSRTAVTELYDWLAGTRLPITEDGDFIAYKKVNDQFFDFYTGKVLNKPAELMTDAERAQLPVTVGGVTTEVVAGYTQLSMPRNQVDDNRDRTCSQGLHFCSLSYLPSYHGGRGRVLLVRINPADVVSIPSDYDFAKGRAWRYVVLAEHDAGETTEAFNTSVVSNTGEVIRDNSAAPKNEVMGVDFGSPARAEQVQHLLDVVGGRTWKSTPNDSVSQAENEGFDDAWDNRQPNIMRFSGSNLRDAVAYAQAYYKGYDACRGKLNVPGSTASPATVTTVTPVKSRRNPALVGYNQGRKDGAVFKFNLSTQEFTGSDRLKYEAAYIKGYDSVK